MYQRDYSYTVPDAYAGNAFDEAPEETPEEEHVSEAPQTATSDYTELITLAAMLFLTPDKGDDGGLLLILALLLL